MKNLILVSLTLILVSGSAFAAETSTTFGTKNLGSVEDLDTNIVISAITESFNKIEMVRTPAVDLGIIKVDAQDSNSPYGAIIENVNGLVNWVSGTAEELEKISEFGTSVKVIGEDALFSSLPGKMVASIDFAVLRDFQPLTINAGAKYKPLENVSIKVGIDSIPLSGEESSTTLSAGVGAEFAGLKFDYSFNSNLNSQGSSTHSFSISLLPEA